MFERLGAEHFGIGGDADDREQQQVFRGRNAVDESLHFCESGASRRDDGYVWGATRRGRLGAIVRDAGRGATGTVRL